MGEDSEDEDQNEAEQQHTETGTENEAVEMTDADAGEQLATEGAPESGTGEEIHTSEVN